MHLITKILDWILAIMGVTASALALFVISYSIYRWIMVKIIFKKHSNPFVRECRRCTSVQNMYQSNIEHDNSTWWEEMYDGNDADCRCHKYAESRHNFYL